MTIQTVKLSELEPSPHNMRKFDAKAGDDLVASIKARGLLQPLVTYKSGKKFYVSAGGRRLAALRKLKFADPIPIIVREESEALGDSLIENFNRRNPTSLEIWEALTAIDGSGNMTQAQIAKQLGVETKEVQKAVRLGKLHPDILQALRDGNIDERSARAYAASDDPEQQLEVFNDTSINWDNDILRAYGFGSWEEKRNLKIVGREAYEKAGGKITENLFGDDLQFSDPALLQKMADQIKAKVNKAYAKKLGIPALTSTDGYVIDYTISYKADDETEAQIEQLYDELHELEYGSDERNAINDKLDKLTAKRLPIFQEDREYGAWNESIYIKEFDVPESTEEEAPTLSNKARETLAEMRAIRRGELMHAKIGTDWVGPAFFLMARSAANTAEGFLRHEKARALPDIDWLYEPDDAKAWELYLEDKMSAREAGRILGAMISSYEANAFIDNQITTDKVNLKWESTPAFWKLFHKRELILERINEFSPHMAMALANDKLSRIRDLAHAACSGDEVPEAILPAGEDADAATSWMPAELRFEAAE